MDYGFVNNGGECGALIRAIDWSKNSLGPIEKWPQSLRTTLSIILNSKFPMFLFWGPSHICFYNDAYRPSLGNEGKHPKAMGQRGEETWPEIWEFIKPQIDQVLAGGEATWYEDQLLPIYRNGAMEDVYWTFSYSPTYDETGNPAGVFVTCTETTEKVNNLLTIGSNNAELQFAVNAARLGTWDLNPLTNKFTANNRLKKWFGLPADAIIDLNAAINSIIEKDQPRVREAILKALDYNSGGNYEVDYTIVDHENGRERMVRAKGKALYNDDKIAYRLNGTLQDITNDAAKNQALKDSEENFRKLILQAPIGMIILKGEDFFVELVNDAYLKLAAKTRGEFAEKLLWDALPEAKTLGFDKILKKVMQTGNAYRANEQPLEIIKNGNREVVFVNFVYEPLKDIDGIINRIMVLAVDVTEMLESKRKIQDAEERARLAVEAAGLGIFDLDLKSGKLKTSGRFNEIFGFDQMVQRSDYVKAIHKDDHDIRLNAHKAALSTGLLNYEVRIIWPDQSLHWVRTAGKIYYDTDNNPVRMLGTMLDITNTKQLEQQKDDFLGIASHELKTPVTSIKAYAQVLEKTLLKKGALMEAGLMKKMDAQVNRLTSLIGDLLDVTKVNSGKLQYNHVHFDFNEMVRFVIEDLQHTTEKHQIIEDLNDIGFVFGDKERVSQVLTNLVSNAIKYSPDASEIIIHTHLEGENVVLCVEDFGIGIAANKLNMVFDQFYRVSGNMQHTFPGLGLGLYISSEIIRRAGGRIWADSKEGKGSRFCFSIPIQSQNNY
jgi:PAS domain S-box-containing protein